MDELDSRMYYGLKDALRKVDENIKDETLNWGNLPVILIDFWNWKVFYFEDKYDAEEYLENNHTEWDDSPPEGEDEELIIIKFCTQKDKDDYSRLYRDYKFYKEINGEKTYRQKSFVEFEPELIINVMI